MNAAGSFVPDVFDPPLRVLHSLCYAHKIPPAIMLTGIIFGGILDFRWNLQKALDTYLIGFKDELKILIHRELTYEHE